VAVSIAVWAAPTAEIVAAKTTAFAPAGMVTVAGTATAELLLARVTVNPPVGAAAFSETVQLSLPAPVIEATAQLNELKAAVSAVPAAVPVPLSPIASFPPLGELLITVNSPVAGPIAVGVKFTLKLKVPPAGTVIGRSLVRLAENGCPVTSICETWTAAERSFTIETFELAVWPDDTAPNAIDVGDA
jgi:hypothetical protein